MKRALVALAVVLAVVVALARWEGADDEPAAQPSAPETTEVEPVFPALEMAWTSDVDSVRIDDALREDGVVVLRTGRDLVGVDDATGRRLWTRRLREICVASEQLHDGMIVVAHTPKGRRSNSCNDLLAVKVATGKVVWRRTVPDGVGSWHGDPGHLAVGRKVVTTRTSVCGGVRRFRLADGTPLKSIAPLGNDDLACDDFALRGGLIAQVSSNDDQDPEEFRLLDADTGKVVFARPAGDLALSNIISVEPLLMDLTVDGHRLIWSVDEKTGKLGPPTGRQWQARSDDITTAGMHDGVVAVREFASTVGTSDTGIAGYSVSGEQVWSNFPESGSLAGSDDRGFVVISAGLADDETGQHDLPVTRHDWSDVDDYEVLGTVPRDVTSRGVVGDLLLVESDNWVAAYRLPESGEESDRELLASEDKYALAVPEESWVEGDVRAPDTLTCEVSAENLKALGFHRVDLPRPVGCAWQEWGVPDNFLRDLEVGHHLAKPVGERTAVEMAREEIERLRNQHWATGPGADGLRADVRALPGVGDEAIVVEAVGVGGRRARIGVAVRVRNVLVWAHIEAEVRSSEASGMVAPHLYQPALLSVVRDILADAELPVDAPEVSIRRTPALKKGTNLCRALDEQIGWMLPGQTGRRLNPGGDDRASGCSWQELPGDHDSAQVSMNAVPDSPLTGRRGEKLAADGLKSALHGLRASSYEPADKPVVVEGLGDEAWIQTNRTWMHRSRLDETRNRDWYAATLIVRRGNLTMSVVLQQEHVDHAALRERAIRLARLALATQD